MNKKDKEIERLRDALHEYGKHDIGCSHTRIHGWIPEKGYIDGDKYVKEMPKCTCGFEEVLKGE